MNANAILIVCNIRLEPFWILEHNRVDSINRYGPIKNCGGISAGVIVVPSIIVRPRVARLNGEIGSCRVSKQFSAPEKATKQDNNQTPCLFSFSNNFLLWAANPTDAKVLTPVFYGEPWASVSSWIAENLKQQGRAHHKDWYPSVARPSSSCFCRVKIRRFPPLSHEKVGFVEDSCYL